VTMRDRSPGSDDSGFTLIELMVVVLIIAVLIAIAIPTFLGAQNRARDRAAQSDLRNALTALRTVSIEQDGKFRSAPGVVLVAADLQAVEPSLTFTDTPPLPTGTDVGVLVTDSGDTMEMLRTSAGGTRFALLALSDGRSFYCKNPTATLSLVNCTGTRW
jgi:type IV pilus assembly protein PilA